MKAAHNVLYKKHVHTNERFISCDGHQLHALRGCCRSRSRGCALYRDASRAAYVLGPPPSRGRDLELEGGVNACVLVKVCVVHGTLT